jgi:hypothetical protein
MKTTPLNPVLNILKILKTAGLTLGLSAGQLVCRGRREGYTEGLRALVDGRREELVAFLEAVQERACIMHYDGQVPWPEAERQAFEEATVASHFKGDSGQLQKPK